MSIKPDHWIEKMAREHGMIEPFEAGQVKEGVISYGVSSYGYDIRVADEFKIFTNVNNTVVDPKDFDNRSFVEFKGDVCTIPPNSFALARTIEYFRIPRNILTICVGKCVTGDTRIIDAETGAYMPISQAAIINQTVGMSEWRLGSVEVSDFIPNGKKPVYELTTRMGLKIRATANHPFRQLQGWTSLAELQPGDRIAVTRHIPIFGKTPLPKWAAILLGLMIAEGQCNAKPNRAYQWLKQYGLNVNSIDKFVPQAIFMAPKETVAIFLKALFSGDGSIYASGQGIFLEYYSSSRRLIEDVHHLLLRFGIVSLIRERQPRVGSKTYTIQITDREQIYRFSQEIGFWPGSEKQVRLEQEIMPLLLARSERQRSNFDTLPREGWELMGAAVAEAQMSLHSLGIEHTQPSQSLPYSIAMPVAKATGNVRLSALVNGPIWDVVKHIEYVGEEEVYDLIVPGAHNFVANDFIVHNSTYARCGIIVNVTPFEPEWEGYVTLEISNTTPLPARIYANEGIAQVVFFQADEECRTSYADKKGKYQKQVGITLPKIDKE